MDPVATMSVDHDGRQLVIGCDSSYLAGCVCYFLDDTVVAIVVPGAVSTVSPLVLVVERVLIVLELCGVDLTCFASNDRRPGCALVSQWLSRQNEAW